MVFWISADQTEHISSADAQLKQTTTSNHDEEKQETNGISEAITDLIKSTTGMLAGTYESSAPPAEETIEDGILEDFRERTTGDDELDKILELNNIFHSSFALPSDQTILQQTSQPGTNDNCSAKVSCEAQLDLLDRLVDKQLKLIERVRQMHNDIQEAGYQARLQLAAVIPLDDIKRSDEIEHDQQIDMKEEVLPSQTSWARAVNASDTSRLKSILAPIVWGSVLYRSLNREDLLVHVVFALWFLLMSRGAF